MKVNQKFEFSDSDRQSIRALLGRKGKSSRIETRVFIERAIRDAIGLAPEVTQRRPRVTPETQTPGRQRLEVLQALPDETPCAKCARPKVDHGRMGLTCLPSSGRARGERFTQVSA